MPSDPPSGDTRFARGGGFGGSYLYERLSTELLAICRGLLMDGALVDREISELDRWCRTNPAVARVWPGNVLVDRLRRVMADGEVDEDERRDLHLLLEEVTGYVGGHQVASPTIYTEPPPELVIIDETFALTGTFLYGPRRKVIDIIELIGGHASSRLTTRTDYLLVGGRATPAWLQADRGGKIIEVLEHNKLCSENPGDRYRGAAIPIVSEEHWSTFILKPPSGGA